MKSALGRAKGMSESIRGEKVAKKKRTRKKFFFLAERKWARAGGGRPITEA